MAARVWIYCKLIIASETCKATIAAAVCLHNFLKLVDDTMLPLMGRYCLPGFSDTLSPDGDMIFGSWKQEDSALDHGRPH
ncbi:hypothetical protein CEXT_41961 [Caerostris extrusa]|uniref:Uncharacterized protein n=1 Tax=Caerostris extrusa TaxID=172846 RepID=A0AAV4VX28_CAEEX|nr:hypothetical protein CEXT_41961 [Caerostris extrusa]